MASINSVSNSNMTSSLYNSANVISGLASGLDTEGMIESLVQSYQKKIQSLNNKATKIEWKQEVYRSIISKMYAFSNKYASYSSATNLMSSSFFTNAVKVATLGANKDRVSATGRTDSDVKINSVKQLATSARYNTRSNLKGVDTNFSVAADKAVSFTDDFDTSALTGSLVLTYGDKTVSVVFDSTDIIEDYVYKTDENGEYELVNGKRVVERTRSHEEKAADLQKLIEKKLEDSTITLSNGESRKASELIEVKRSGGTIRFEDKSTGGNNVYISDASGTVKSKLGLDLTDADEKKPASFTITSNTRLVTTQEIGRYISSATMNVSLDGKTKTISLPNILKGDDGYEFYDTASGKYVPLTGDSYAKALQTALDKEFGAGKIKVTNEAGPDDPNALKLNFKAPDNSNLIVNTDVGDALGIGNTATNYLDTTKTLGDLLDDSVWDKMTPSKIVSAEGDGRLYAFTINGVTVGHYGKDTKLSTILNDINNNKEANVTVSYSQTTRQFSFASKDTGSENNFELGSGLAQTMFGAIGVDGNKATFTDAYGLDLANGESKKVTFEVPGEISVEFSVTNTYRMKDIAEKLQEEFDSFEMDYTVTYHETSGQLVVTDRTGKRVDLKVTADDQEVKSRSTSASYVPGQDAVFTVEVNGQEMEMIRGSNSNNIDGLTVTLKDTFNQDYEIGGTKETEAVSFQISTDSDKIVDAVKSMIEDYNEMILEIKAAYSTLPYQDSSGAFKTYEPLSDDDKASMSESAIQSYEAKAKQGILFNDNNLSTLYQRLSEVFKLDGEDGSLLKQMGITWTYSSDNTATLTLDESKLRNVLDTDLDAVADLFTRSVDVNATSNGIMQTMKAHLDRYGATTGAVKGILVEQAGTPLSSLTLINNSWQKQIDNLGNEITKWQDKLSAQVDRYTSMFSKLESLIYQMNAQSSTLAGMMGGYGY